MLGTVAVQKIKGGRRPFIGRVPRLSIRRWFGLLSSGGLDHFFDRWSRSFDDGWPFLFTDDPVSLLPCDLGPLLAGGPSSALTGPSCWSFAAATSSLLVEEAYHHRDIGKHSIKLTCAAGRQWAEIKSLVITDFASL